MCSPNPGTEWHQQPLVLLRLVYVAGTNNSKSMLRHGRSLNLFLVLLHILLQICAWHRDWVWGKMQLMSGLGSIFKCERTTWVVWLRKSAELGGTKSHFKSGGEVWGSTCVQENLLISSQAFHLAYKRHCLSHKICPIYNTEPLGLYSARSSKALEAFTVI